MLFLLNLYKKGYNHMWRSKNRVRGVLTFVGWFQHWPNIKVLLVSWCNNDCTILFLLLHCNMARAIKSNIRNYSDVSSIQWRCRCRFCDRFLQHVWSQKGALYLLHVLVSRCTMQLLWQFLSSLSYGLFVLQQHIYGLPRIKCLGLLWPQDVTVISTQPSLP